MKRAISFFRASLRHWRRHLVGVMIAVAGLACAFGLSLLAMLFVYDGMTSDAWLKDADRLYRINDRWLTNGQRGVFGNLAYIPAATADLVRANVDGVDAITRLLTKEGGHVSVGDASFDITAYLADANMADVLALPMKAGKLDALASPSSAILSESEALRLLGPDALGKTLTVTFGSHTESFKVAGIFRDIPANSQLDMKVILPWRDTLVVTSENDDLDWARAYTFLKLKEGASADLAAKAIADQVAPLLAPPMVNVSHELSIEAVKGGRYHTEAYMAMRDNIDHNKMQTILVMAAVLLAVAGFNFTHVFTSINLSRGREIAVRRISGAGRGHLVAMFLLEACLLAVVAFGLGLLLAADSTDYMSDLLGTSVPIFGPGRAPLLALAALVLMGFALLATAHNIARISRIRPQSLLHDAQAAVLSSGARLKAVLLALQSLAVVGSLIGAGQIYYQFNHFLTMDRGIRTVGVLQVKAPKDDEAGATFGGSFFKDAKALPGVLDATRLDDPAFPNGIVIAQMKGFHSGEPMQTMYRRVGPDYFDLMGIKPILTTGEDWHGLRQVIALPVSSLAKLGFASAEEAIGQHILQVRHVFNDDGTQGGQDTPMRIMAIVPDVKDTPYTTGQPVVYSLATLKDEKANHIMLFADRDDPALEAAVRSLWQARFPEAEATIGWLTASIAKRYDEVRNMGQSVLMMAGLCLLLCFAGLYGMASHFTATRAREIALRRVLGARRRDISKLFMRRLLTPVLIGGLLSLAPTWWLLDRMLESIANDRAPLPLVLYGLVLAFVLAVAATMLAGHLRRVLRIHPAHMLRHE